MIIPVRCFSCNKVIANKWPEYNRRVNEGKEEAKVVFKEMGITRRCCKTILLTHVDLIDQLLEYPDKPEVLEEKQITRTLIAR